LPVDPELLRAWLAARSIARGLPEPVPDHGGFRVDTKSEREVRRWVFAEVSDSLRQLGRSIREPGNLLKLPGASDELRGILPARWSVEHTGYFMERANETSEPSPMPPGYRIDLIRSGAVTKVEIRSESGSLAASGYGAETADAFVYDRIETHPEHRRRGLARAVMTALGTCRGSSSTRQLLVATPDGEKLYSQLGWVRLSPYSTAQIQMS
jgi:GNAT superfamily N-acetyltransferase